MEKMDHLLAEKNNENSQNSQMEQVTQKKNY